MTITGEQLGLLLGFVAFGGAVVGYLIGQYAHRREYVVTVRPDTITICDTTVVERRVTDLMNAKYGLRPKAVRR